MKEDVVKTYVSKIITEFKTGQAREHAYRPALKYLFEAAVPRLQAINDPKHSEYGAPDFALMHTKELSAGYAEAKDVTANLDIEEKNPQMERYFQYGSLILTNSLEFRFFRHGDRYGDPIVIAKFENGHIVPNEKSFTELEDTLRTFLTKTERITSSSKLAKIMGDKARRIREKVSEYICTDRGTELCNMYESFKKILIHDLSEKQFADMYAQTLVYGLFAARYEDKTPESFTRQEARDLVPHSNPFLRNFFDHITGVNFDIRLTIIVNELCEIFKNADVHDLMNQYASKKSLTGDGKNFIDPVIHFYEDFLKEYDAEQKKKFGAFYTPLPVVQFIIRATDYILKKEFNIADGLSDTTEIKIKLTKQNKTAKELTHKVQILDPACGTGTFLNELIKDIYSHFKGQEGRWKSYVEDGLLPRLHGFELMMTPYTIAHLKIAMTFHDTGVVDLKKRLGIYLTNSLEEGEKTSESLFGFGFGQSITEESIAASKIKNDTPIMVIIGNPPYSISSSNKSEWILNLIEDYKKDLNERKINLDDDYIKFIRLAEHFIEKNESGVVAMITNNSFIGGITHRQMRKHLLETFDSVYILDLHGNSRLKEKTPDGGKDENVFDIQQGVSINIFIKKENKKRTLGNVYYSEIWGSRENKFDVLNKSNIENTKWKKLDYQEPYYFFVPKDFEGDKEYERGFKIDELFTVSNSGVKTDRDSLFIDFDKKILENRFQKLLSSDFDDEFKTKYRVINSGSYKLTERLKGKIFDEKYIQPIQYRPFDYQWIYYDPEIISRPGAKVFKYIANKENIGLIAPRLCVGNRGFEHGLVSKFLVDVAVGDAYSGSGTYFFPLYLYTEDNLKIPNLKKDIIDEIEIIVGKITPENILDYIYAVLYSPSYREKYKEFLKIDFPRIPYPKGKKQFGDLIKFGEELRHLHSFEGNKLSKSVTTYSVSGDDIIEKISYKDEKVFINKTQYFGKVPEIAYNFYIGGYQPAQKWLKDRKGRKLTDSDIKHYQKIIVALVETDRIMREIDSIK